MMCEHCEATVQKALEAVPGVTDARASHAEGLAVVELNQPVPDEALRAAVEAEDYQVTQITDGEKS